MQVLIKCLIYRLLAGLAFGVAVFGVWRALDAPLPWPGLRLVLGAVLGFALFTFFMFRSAVLPSLLFQVTVDAAALTPLPWWLYGVLWLAGIVATVLVSS